MNPIRSKAPGSKTKVYLWINNIVKTKLDLIADVENLPKELVLEKLISNYVPIPTTTEGGKFRTIFAPHARRLRRIKPTAIIRSVWPGGRIGIPSEIYKDWKNGNLTWLEYKRKYTEYLLSPKPQEEITKLLKFKETQDIYVMSFEKDEEHSLRKIFVDFMNDGMVWK